MDDDSYGLCGEYDPFFHLRPNYRKTHGPTQRPNRRDAGESEEVHARGGACVASERGGKARDGGGVEDDAGEVCGVFGEES